MLVVRLGIVFVFLTLALGAQTIQANWSLDVESGLASSGYNDVRIPGDIGTDISLSEGLKAERVSFVRLRLVRDLNDRHQLSVLFAPLRFKSSGTVNREINFNGVRFAAGAPLNSHYRFDSYRLTYHYTIVSTKRVRAGLGFTGKIRDASIRIDDGGTTSEKTNTGFVPLVNFAIDWRLKSNLGLLFKGDALAAPQGRAEDVLLAIYGKPSDKLRIRLGYRILEGGADNDEVYTFALVHYVSAGVTWTL